MDSAVVGNELTKEQKDIVELQKIARQLHEDLRNYGSLEGENKATVISAILLALMNHEFHESSLAANASNPDGAKIVDAVGKLLTNTGAVPADKVDVLLNTFSFLKTSVVLNAKNETLNMTPIRYYATQLRHQVSLFIGATATNNGVTDFVDYTRKEKKVAAGVIGVNRNGSVGYAFYYPYQAYFSGGYSLYRN